VGAASPAFRTNVSALKRENLRWFLYSGVFVAMAQGLYYSALAIAPIMVVAAPVRSWRGSIYAASPRASAAALRIAAMLAR
jgi:hypothetical protein